MLDSHGSASDHRHRKTGFNMSDIFYILSWKQPKQLCVQGVFDNDERWKYYDLAQTLLFAKLLSSCSVICILCGSIANFGRPSIIHSGEWDHYFWKKIIPISCIGLENRMKKFTSFNRQNGSFSLNGTSCLQLIPQVSSGKRLCFPLVCKQSGSQGQTSQTGEGGVSSPYEFCVLFPFML